MAQSEPAKAQTKLTPSILLGLYSERPLKLLPDIPLIVVAVGWSVRWAVYGVAALTVGRCIHNLQRMKSKYKTHIGNVF